MINELKDIYEKLHACDMNLLLRVEDHSYKNISADLNFRAECIRSVEVMILLLPKQLPQDQLSQLRKLHERALNSDRQLKKVMKSLYNKAREEFLQTSPQRHRPSPYAQKSSGQTRIST